MGKTVAVTDASFQQEVLDSDKLVMVDFWAPWCGPCRAVAPILEELAGEYADKMTIAKVNTDEDAQNASKLMVRGIPTLIFFRDGKEVDRIVGAGPKSMYKTKIDALLG